ncbi:zinc metallopeptidase [Paenibacillus psychroresistens]|uniref:Zinc metallopeptidase n=1 Tax=Paenibacillus psychroresistens TaxID=1778678 RepID=A0A6B8RQ65_9BACL|nr:zinc metallopeptidase [Paenibacillus psychroresistens]QGQ97438.1 zinc metallopeptidase [Paenibacillus psychroresistens]
MLFYFHWMDYFIYAMFAVSLWASFRVKSTFNKWAEVPNQAGVTGYEAARRMLDANGLYDVAIEPIAGRLTDHYDPTTRIIRLSEPVYYEKSISAVAVACHEVGHAVQHKVHYPMLVARHKIFPAVNFSSGLAPLLIIGGFIFSQFHFLLTLGIILFSVAVIFQLITLPVEFNASTRARRAMGPLGFVHSDEQVGVGKVLNAAAMTYVAAALISVLTLIKYILMARSND